MLPNNFYSSDFRPPFVTRTVCLPEILQEVHKKSFLCFFIIGICPAEAAACKQTSFELN
jgi:hypothetical protein